MQQSETVKELIELIRSKGGYVNPKLKLLVGEEAEFGGVSLAGVPDDELSLHVPFCLQEYTQGPWLTFLASLGYDIKHPLFVRCHSFGDGCYPILGAANHHKHDEPGGRLEHDSLGYKLYGCTFCYGNNDEYLARVWGEYVEQGVFKG